MFVRNDGGMKAAGFSEHNDCAVRAYATFKDIPYSQAHGTFKFNGRKDRRATPFSVIKAILGDQPLQRGLTINGLLKAFPKGRVYAVIRGHALAIVDGTINDTWKVGLKSRVKYYWTDGTELPQPGTNTMHPVDKKAEALRIYNELRGMKSKYAIAKEIAARMGITVANANYYVTRVFDR